MSASRSSSAPRNRAPHQPLDPLLTYGGQRYWMKPGATFPKNWWWTHGAFIQRVPPDDNKAAHLIRHSFVWSGLAPLIGHYANLELVNALHVVGRVIPLQNHRY